MGDVIRHMTPSRLRWMSRLNREGIADRTGHGRAAYDCWVLGWTDWACLMHDSGMVRPLRDGPSFIYGRPPHTIIGEMLTDAGYAELKAAGG